MRALFCACALALVVLVLALARSPARFGFAATDSSADLPMHVDAEMTG
jgi:hypothetical protein